MNIGEGRSEGADLPLGDRYVIVRELDSQNGQSYLVKDKDHSEELCLAKSFLPSVQDESTLEEAKFLFEQEADLLYQLDHSQLPKFRQLLEVPALSGAGGQLFLIQDYVAGLTYQDILQNRQQIGGRFHEAEINQLLHQLLPVLSYIHSKGLVHRDICPENIVHRQTDMLPVLIDFGSVKALTASVRSRLGMEGVATIGKAGYIPPDQVGGSHVDQTSDLYGLAATMLTLVTGESPQQLYHKNEDSWRGIETLSPKLGNVLLSMLAQNAEDRFPTAEAVLDALRADGVTDLRSGVTPDEMTAFRNVGDDPLVDNPIYDGAVPVGLAGGMGAAAGAIAAGMTGATSYEGAEGFSPEVYVENYDVEGEGDDSYRSEAYAEATPFDEGPIDPSAPMSPVIPMMVSADSAANESATYEPEIDEREEGTTKEGDRLALLGLLGVLGLTGLLLLLAIPRLGGSTLGTRLQRVEPVDNADPARINQVRLLADGEYVPEETARKQAISLRREDLGIGEGTFTGIVNQLFYQEYPQLLTAGSNGGRKELTPSAADEPLRIRWDHIALDMLGKLENNFSPRSLNAVGSYGENSREGWRSLIAPADIPERALTDLADAKFFQLFPDQSGRDFTSQPMGQLYYAIADDTARAIQSGAVTEPIRFAAGSFSQDVRGQIAPGEGRIYTLSLNNGQLLRMNLNAPTDSTLLSLYPPTPTADNPAIFSDSEQTTWSGALSETGTYSVVVVNRGRETIDYTLATSVDNVTSAPLPAETEEVVDAEEAVDAKKTVETEDEAQVDLSQPPVAPPRAEEGNNEASE